MFKQMTMVNISFSFIIVLGLSSCFPNPRYSLDKDFNLTNCDEFPIYGIDIDDSKGNVWSIYYEKDSVGVDAPSQLNLRSLPEGYKTLFNGFEANVTYDITIGGGDAMGGFKFLVDSVDGKLQIIEGAQPCEER